MTKLKNLLAVALLATFVAFSLGACSTTATPSTVQESAFVGVEQAVAVANTADQLHSNGIITDQEYADVLDRLSEANSLLSEARTLAEAGDAEAGDRRVQAANQLLLIVRNRLKEAQSE